jgi:MFS family permease
MLPLDVFSSRQFTAANLVTLVIYGAFGTALFLLALQLQTVVGYTPLKAGTALLPVTVVMLLLSARGGRLAQRIGPRLPMALGPVVVGVGLALVGLRAGQGASYLVDVLPGVVTFALGLSLTVAPLTATVLAAADPRHAGVASGVNNAVARAAGLLGVAIIPVLAGLSGDVYSDPVAFGAGFRTGMLIAAGLCVAGGVLAWATIRNDVLAAGPDGTDVDDHAVTDAHCPVSGPPLRQPHRVEAR